MTERQCYESDMVHTNENSFCRYVGWSLEIDIFEVKMMVKSGLDFFYFEIHRAPSELLLPSAIKYAQKG
jgi:hypothetical protein